MSRAFRLVGDIGGTNARVALLDEQGQPGEPVVLRVQDHPDIGQALRGVLGSTLGLPDGARVESAALAVNGPVVGDTIALSNSHWTFSIDALQDTLELDALHVVNDFTALALAVPHLPDAELDQVGPGRAVPRHAIAVIGPGTGLGVSGLVPCGDRWTALQGEGGHVTLGGNNSREQAVQARLAERFDHVSAERFLSGPGLVNMASALREIDGVAPQSDTPATVSERGLAGSDAACEEALHLFCRLLGKVAGNLVLTLGAEGGCYIGGGVAPRLGELLHRSEFRAAFEAKGRMAGYLARIPTYVIHAPYPALIGAARLLD